jgi:hypothetical protein
MSSFFRKFLFISLAITAPLSHAEIVNLECKFDNYHEPYHYTIDYDKRVITEKNGEDEAVFPSPEPQEGVSEPTMIKLSIERLDSNLAIFQIYFELYGKKGSKFITTIDRHSGRITLSVNGPESKAIAEEVGHCSEIKY